MCPFYFGRDPVLVFLFLFVNSTFFDSVFCFWNFLVFSSHYVALYYVRRSWTHVSKSCCHCENRGVLFFPSSFRYGWAAHFKSRSFASSRIEWSLFRIQFLFRGLIKNWSASLHSLNRALSRSTTKSRQNGIWRLRRYAVGDVCDACETAWLFD